MRAYINKYVHLEPSTKNQLSKPQFLAKYIPPTPPPENRQSLIRPQTISRSVSRSPCPSPTPLFQQLYHAVSHWERIMADSPDELMAEKQKLIKDLENLPKSKIYISRDDGDDTDDERSNEPSPVKVSTSMVELYNTKSILLRKPIPRNRSVQRHIDMATSSTPSTPTTPMPISRLAGHDDDRKVQSSTS